MIGRPSWPSGGSATNNGLRNGELVLPFAPCSGVLVIPGILAETSKLFTNEIEIVIQLARIHRL